METWANTSNSKWVRLQSGESIVLQFDETKMKIVQKDFKGDGKMVERAEFGVETEDGSERTLELSKMWAQQVLALIKKGHRRIEISRRGNGTETQYTFVPA
jgi:hypothetical protein